MTTEFIHVLKYHTILYRFVNYKIIKNLDMFVRLKKERYPVPKRKYAYVHYVSSIFTNKYVF